VRELEHAVEHAVIMADGRMVTSHHLPSLVLFPLQNPLEVAIPGSTLAEIERAAILKSMMATRGSATEAAAMLGISRSKIYYCLRNYGRLPAHPMRLTAGETEELSDSPGEADRR
jgi:DNA-binding NtrC family response regulator